MFLGFVISDGVRTVPMDGANAFIRETEDLMTWQLPRHYLTNPRS